MRPAVGNFLRRFTLSDIVLHRLLVLLLDLFELVGIGRERLAVSERILVQRAGFTHELGLRLQGRDRALDLLQHSARIVVGDVARGTHTQFLGKLPQPVEPMLRRAIVAVKQVLDLIEAHRLADVHLLVGVARLRVLRQDVSWMVGRSHVRSPSAV